MLTIVKPAELHAGDVFLYHGDGFISSLIRLFDGTEYSHSSIWNGNHVVEALGQGVVGQSLKASVTGANYVDVYRYKNKDTGLSLGDDTSPLPAKPVLSQANQFEKDHDRYAYEEILLLALLASTRQVTAPIPFLGMILRNLLDNAADVLGRLMSAGKEPLICSELVYRCFTQAGNSYAIRIRGSDTALASVVALDPLSTAAQAQEDSTGYPAAATAFLENYRAAKRHTHASVQPVSTTAMAASDALTGSAVADFVTPGDLKRSPDLQLVGTLSV